MEGRPGVVSAMPAVDLFRPAMRGYFIPLAAGLVLAASTFLPWVVIGDTALSGMPAVPALWVAGLGALAAVLAALSIITRRNSRHPLLVIGLASLGIMILSWRIMPRSAGERALTLKQAFAIVEDTPLGEAPIALVGSGIYVGLAASAAIVAFGMTIVVKRASQAYAVTSPDDDV
jgi:FtsH-binding integral membrane protein